MATYAALVSLINVLNRIQHPNCAVSGVQPQIQSLFVKVSSLVDFMEASPQTVGKDLERRMIDVAFAAENSIESYFVDPILARSAANNDEGYDPFCQDLEKAIQEMDLITQEVMEVKEMNRLPQRPVHVGLLMKMPPTRKNKTMGLDQELIRLMEQLTTDQSSRQIISVVGMGGIGKTTLAKNVYNHPYVRHHFHIQAWVTIYQEYSVRSIIHVLLRDTGFGEKGGKDDEIDVMDDEKLGEQLYRTLWGKKYLIVLDDIWSSRAWDEIRRFFPDKNNGSRILLTTRLLTVALGVGSCNPYELKLLDDIKSWELLSEIVFGHEACYPELEKLGKKIAMSCKGLPLAIVVIGGLLKISQRTREHWMNVANNVNSIINTENDGHCMEVLSLSYNHLPIYLKSCFLYMATFREVREIRVFDLINLWVADGLIRPMKYKTLGDVAMEYLNDLIDRNLIMVATRDLCGKIQSCIVHDALREFCLREVQNEKFICFIEDNTLKLPQILESERRFVCCTSYHVDIPTLQPMPHARSFVCYSGSPRLASGCRFLRVYHVSNAHEFRVDIRELVNIQHLAFKISKLEVPRLLSSLSLFRKLETLVVEGIVSMILILPSEIWELPNLKHLVFIKAAAVLPGPTAAQVNCVLNNLQSLYDIDHFNCTDEVLRMIPNLNELRTYYYLSLEAPKISRSFTNVARLHKLEKLSIHFDLFERSYVCVSDELENLTFSPNLRELELSGSKIPWENMTIFGSLPTLEVLILGSNAFCGEEWSPIEGQFQHLKYLLISGCYLKIWRAEGAHFPRLEKLYLEKLELEEIPLGIGDVLSLELISFDTNYVSVAISAKEILDEQQNQGNDVLIIEGCCYYTSQEDKAELENFENDMFQVQFKINREEKQVGNNISRTSRAIAKTQVLGAKFTAAQRMEAGNCSAQLEEEYRQRIVNKIFLTLQKHLPFSGQEGLEELKRISLRFEEKIYTGATSQSDYLSKISLKMLTMESKS